MGDPWHVDPAESLDAPAERDEFDSVPTGPADIESAGRSCMAIVVLAVIILLLLLVWIGYRSFGGH